ncbi:SDR family NAD(P)-dependent oxidoreductase [Paraburkholderia agricolaris]|uniref:SDR family NAD(P)-dependent oxidoreductase n=1 Tax=Paraburkholderia agricolaris TaxID=2152888 RepID=UPI0012909F4E|nr:SDR family oxidoreductase [Paraburkholderia agricolaris]
MTDQPKFATYPSLKGKRVLVTGGASGIGADLVTQFCAQGANVAFLDIDNTAAESLLAQLRDKGLPGACYAHCDLRDIQVLRRKIATVERQLGGIDVLVNNAARDDRHSLDSLEPDYWDESLQVNLRHQIFASQAVAKGMRTAGGGSIIMFGSVTWMRGRPGFIGYTSSKAAINGATRTMARELGDDNIRVNCVLPGLVLTQRAQDLWFSPEQVEEFVQTQALGYPLAPPDISRMVLFLAADDSRGCTGQNFIVDAGVTLN